MKKLYYWLRHFLFGKHWYKITWWAPNVEMFLDKKVVTYTCHLCDYGYSFTGEQYTKWLEQK